MLKGWDVSNSISPADFNRITLHICLSVLIFLMTHVCSLKSHREPPTPPPTHTLLVGRSSVFICCCASIEEQCITRFGVDGIHIQMSTALLAGTCSRAE